MVDYSLELWETNLTQARIILGELGFSRGAPGEIYVSEEGFYLPTDPRAATGRSHAHIVCLLGRAVRRERLCDEEGNLFGITEMKRLLTPTLRPSRLRLHLRRSFRALLCLTRCLLSDQSCYYELKRL